MFWKSTLAFLMGMITLAATPVFSCETKLCEPNEFGKCRITFEDFIVHFDRDLAKLDSSISQLIQQSQSKIFGSFSLKRGSQVVRRVQMLRRGFDSARANINPEMPLVLQVTPLTLDSSLNLDYTLLAGIAVIKLPIAAEYIYSGEIPDRAAIVCLGQTLDVKIDAMTHELLGVMNPSLDCHVVKPVEERKRIRR